MSDNTYTIPGQIDLQDLATVVMIEWNTATCIRLNPRDYRRLGHPMFAVSPDKCHWLPVHPSSDVPVGTLDAPPAPTTKPHTGHLSRLLGRMVAKLRREL